MSIGTPVKRDREEAEAEPVKQRKVEEDIELHVDIKGLSEITMVQVVGKTLNVAERNLTLNEKMVKATDDNTCV